jgi:hypothetical protein
VKTTLNFQGPGDLSVGTIRIDGVQGAVVQWIATPDNRTFQAEHVEPGMYAVEIGPSGVAPQSVVFEVREGQGNTVILPPFSTLSASGSNVSFYDTATGVTHAGLARPVQPAILALLSSLGGGVVAPRGETRPVIESAAPRALSGEKRRISIGLSEGKGSRERFDKFRGKVRMEVFTGRIELDILHDLLDDAGGGRRIRLSAAIEDVRIERCLLPLYRGGTRVTVSTPAFAPADLELSIMPIDPHQRALLRVLDAGTSEEVKEVWHSVVDGQDRPAGLYDVDPWAAILSGLLSIRFPDSVPADAPNMVAAFLERADWAFDTHVIRASQVLSRAQSSDAAAQQRAVAKVLPMLARAQVEGAPYYRYTNQLFGDMVAGLSNYFAERGADVNPAAARRFDDLRRRWYRELPLQRGAGPTFTWLARDARALKEHRTLAPERHPSGRLDAHRTSVVFQGELSAGKITLLGDPGARRPPRERTGRAIRHARSDPLPGSLVPGMPAAEFPAHFPDDPNKGRFGGAACCAGYALAAAFEATGSADWATVVLTVEAQDAGAIGLEDVAWFVLHPTFSPAAVKVPFRGHRAQLRIRAWGGFTVGAWIPKDGVQLEFDLARTDGAPAIIRTR